MNVKLLDCTLRDGAYLIDKDFGEDTIYGLINGLVESKIDIIEIGFFQDEGFGKGKAVYLNSKAAKKYIPKDKKNCLFTVLADYSRYSIKNLDKCDKNSIDGIRECFFKTERKKAIKAFKRIKELGYKLFIQPVDILGYSTNELIDLINDVNEIKPYCFSIVDTFGSMYKEDLLRIFNIIDKHLISSCKIGFHSHNNMQLSNSLSQEIIRIAHNKKDIIIDSTLEGMGRGAGNTPTELIAQYINTNLGFKYKLDEILDLIDIYINNFKSRCFWGYSTSYFIAGCYNSHVNTVNYLINKNTINSKDISFILDKISSVDRKRYNYDVLEKAYNEYISNKTTNFDSLCELKNIVEKRKILVLAPGSSITVQKEKIINFVKKYKPLIISINFIPSYINCDFIYLNNIKRYKHLKNSKKFVKLKKILGSNISTKDSTNLYSVPLNKLIKSNDYYKENSTLLLFNLLDNLSVKEINVGGFDGYRNEQNNYVDKYTEIITKDNSDYLNESIIKMLKYFYANKETKALKVNFITDSIFSKIKQ